MRWSPHNDTISVCAITANVRSTFCLDHEGRIAELDRAGRVVTDTLWPGATSIALRFDQELFVADTSERIWRADPAKLDPRDGALLATRVGRVQAIAADNGNGLVALVGPPSGGRTPGPRTQRPDLLRGTRLLRIDVHDGTAPVEVRLPWSTGLAVHPNGSAAFVATAAGTLIAVDLSTDTTSVLRSDLVRPEACGWVTPGSVLGIAEADDQLALVDLTTGELRRLLRVPSDATGLTAHDDLLIVGSTRGTWWLALAEADLRRVHLHDPDMPVYRGGYARLDLDLGLSGISADDLEVEVIGGPEVGMVSASIEHPPNPGNVIVVAGPHPGTYAVEAHLTSGGGAIATAEIEVVDYWRGADGPSQAFTGHCDIFTSGSLGWGSLWNGVLPWSWNYDVKPAVGTRNVAIILADPADLTSPAGADPDYRDAFVNGVPYQGTTASVAEYYNELSGGKLTMSLAGLVQVNLGHPWGDYFELTKHPADGSPIWRFRDELIDDAVWEAAKQLDLSSVDTLVVVVPSPNGGLPIVLLPPLPPLPPMSLFAWPMASGGTFMWGGWGPFPAIYSWTWKPFRLVVMPAEWNALKPPDGVLTALAHELGHTLGMPDLYMTKVRDITGWDLMSSPFLFPALSLPQRVALGWTPAADLKSYNFLLSGPVDEDVVITAAELTATGIPAGEHAGIVIEVQDGRRYYFEYRSTQDPAGGGPAQIADLQLGPDRDQRVVGYDVKAGSYTAPVDRGPIIMLAGDDDDVVAGVFSVGGDYEELDPGGNAIFKVEVKSASDNNATVRVRYQPAVVPTPVASGPDPSIRPWPGNGIWVSPDLTITNEMTKLFGFAAIQNGATNTIIATVTNNTDQIATGVDVGFWVKDFTVSENAPETFIGYAPAKDIAANSSETFSVLWVVPNNRPYGIPGLPYLTHVCLIARIRPMVDASGILQERSAENNSAQTNITLAFSSYSSPTTRLRVPIVVSNPYDDRSVKAHLTIDQDVDGWRTYVEHTWVQLQASQSRSVEVMVECLHSQPGHPDLPDHVLHTPVITAAVGYVWDGGDSPTPLGGGTIEIRPGRATTFEGLDVSRESARGRVVDVANGAPKAKGRILVAARGADGTELSFSDHVSADGSIAVRTPGVDRLPGPVEIEVMFADQENAVCTVRLLVP
jgi:M6 family metalloprotease-like protein